MEVISDNYMMTWNVLQCLSGPWQGPPVPFFFHCYSQLICLTFVSLPSSRYTQVHTCTFLPKLIL